MHMMDAQEKRKRRRLKTRKFAEEEEENEKSFVVHPSGIHVRQKLRARKIKEDRRGGTRNDAEEEVKEKKKFSAFQSSFSKESFDQSAQKQHDKDMDAFIGKGLEERLGRKNVTSVDKDASREMNKHRTIDELALEIAPKKTRIRDEPVATVVTVDEVPVRFEHTLRNIEEMERAKAALLSRPIIQDKKHENGMRGLPKRFGTKR